MTRPDPLSVRMRAAAVRAGDEATRRALLDLGADRIDRLQASIATHGPALHDFLAVLRVLRCMDMGELVAGGALDARDMAGWREFRGNQVGWLLKAAPERQAALWRMVEQRTGYRDARERNAA